MFVTSHLYWYYNHNCTYNSLIGKFNHLKNCGRLVMVIFLPFKTSLSESFMWVSFALNRLPHNNFVWHDIVFKKRGKKWVSSRWKLSWYDYQLSMSFEIKCLWNHGMKLSIESGGFMQVSFHFTWHGSLGNNVMKLPIKADLTLP
jgi:hypothetical protein